MFTHPLRPDNHEHDDQDEPEDAEDEAAHGVAGVVVAVGVAVVRLLALVEAEVLPRHRPESGRERAMQASRAWLTLAQQPCPAGASSPESATSTDSSVGTGWWSPCAAARLRRRSRAEGAESRRRDITDGSGS